MVATFCKTPGFILGNDFSVSCNAERRWNSLGHTVASAITPERNLISKSIFADFTDQK